MNAQDFCFWLQGYFELSGDGDKILTAHQNQIVKDHLALVFAQAVKVDENTGQITNTPPSTFIC